MNYWNPKPGPEHGNNNMLHSNMSSVCGGRWRVCVVQVDTIKWYQVYSIHYTYTHTQIQMQILEVTQRSDRMGRDLIKNGEVRVIKHHLNPPTSCDPAISQTPTTATYTINNPVWSQAGAALPLLTLRCSLCLNVALKEKTLPSGNKHKEGITPCNNL